MLLVALFGPDGAQGAPTPDASLGLPGLGAAAIVLIVASLIVVAWRRRKGSSGIRRSAGGAAVGNALMDLNSSFMPNHANAAVVLKLEEEEHADEAGEGPEPWTPVSETTEPPPYRSDDGEYLN